MRLKEAEIKILLESLSPYFKDSHGKLYLFGSRINDHAKGGDIDLLIMTELKTKKLLREKQGAILVGIHKKIGDRKIDFTIATPEDAQTAPFIKAILTTAILLKEWQRS